MSHEALSWSALPSRVMDKHELRRLVDELAQRPELWRDRLSYSDTDRHYEALYRDDHVDVWLLCWTPRNDTGWHDHDISSGAVHVVQGSLVEHNPRIGGDHVEVVVDAGESFAFGPEHIHRLTGRDRQSASIHAYSPPLWRLGQYAISDHGVMRRVSVSYADELRPIQTTSP